MTNLSLLALKNLKVILLITDVPFPANFQPSSKNKTPKKLLKKQLKNKNRIATNTTKNSELCLLIANIIVNFQSKQLHYVNYKKFQKLNNKKEHTAAMILPLL